MLPQFHRNTQAVQAQAEGSMIIVATTRDPVSPTKLTFCPTWIEADRRRLRGLKTPPQAFKFHGFCAKRRCGQDRVVQCAQRFGTKRLLYAQWDDLEVNQVDPILKPLFKQCAIVRAH